VDGLREELRELFRKEVRAPITPRLGGTAGRYRAFAKSEPNEENKPALNTKLRILPLNYHHYTAEGLNSCIQAIKADARGFRSFQNFRIRILFFLGKLDLSPA
jgi:hypothetical protein